jgi:hypothetical protein
VQLAEAVTIWCASAREVDADPNHESEQKTHRADGADARRRGHEQCEGNCELGDREKDSRWPGEPGGDAELGESCARTVTIRELRQRSDAEHPGEYNPC